MTELFAIDSHDALFASRTSAEEWVRIKAFRDHPRFLDGVRRHAKGLQPLFGYNLLLSKVVLEAWRFQMVVFTLYLHETRDPGDPRSGLTLTNLQRVCRQLGLASPGRVFAFLNIMRIGGYIANVPSDQDRRVVRLEPTVRFQKVVAAWTHNIFASIDAANPGSGLVRLAEEHPDLGREMRTSGAEGLLAGWDAVAPFPEMLHFNASDGGWMMMEHVTVASIGADDRLRLGTLDLDLRNNAKRFGGSRSNLARLLDKAYQLGLLEGPPKLGKEVRFTSQMHCAFLTFLASFLGYFEMHTELALERMGLG